MLECDLKVSIQIMQNLEEANQSFSHPLELLLLMLLLFSFLRLRFLNWFSPNPSQGTNSCRLEPPLPLLEPTGELLFCYCSTNCSFFFSMRLK
jgi:hypothetical protein